MAVAFLAGAPLAALIAGHLAYRNVGRTAYAQRADWHRGPAVLLATASIYGYTGYLPQMWARWRTLGGAWRTSAVPAPSGKRAGTTVMVWADAAGRLTRQR